MMAEERFAILNNSYFSGLDKRWMMYGIDSLNEPENYEYAYKLHLNSYSGLL